MSDPITINLTLSNVPNAARIAVEVNADDTPASLREKAAEASKIPIDSMRLIFRGRLVGKEDDKNAISEFKLEAGSVIHCMGKPAEDAVPAAAAVPTTAGSSVTVTGGAAAAPTSASDASAAPTLASALTTLRTSNPSATYLTGVTTLEKVLSNISKNPMEEKYRKVKRGNAAFNKRLGGLPGGEACMLAVGFSIEDVDGTENYVMQASPDAWPKLMQHVAELGAASQAAKHAAAPPAGGVLPGAMPGMAGMPPMGAMPAAGGGLAGMPGMAALPGMAGMPSMGPGGMPQMTPQMQQAAAQMMQNPEQLQSMLQVRFHGSTILKYALLSIVYVAFQLTCYFDCSYNRRCSCRKESNGAKYAAQ